MALESIEFEHHDPHQVNERTHPFYHYKSIPEASAMGQFLSYRRRWFFPKLLHMKEP
jgi:hypothetical protein